MAPGPQPATFPTIMPTPGPHWIFQASTSSYERPLGIAELGFYWDAQFRRTADIVRTAEVEIHGATPERFLSPATLADIWTILKQRYPLLGASVEERSQDDIVFVVRPDRLQNTSPAELSIQSVKNAEEVEQFVDRVHNTDDHLLSNTLLSCARILRREDAPNRFHLFIQSAHMISDEIAHHTLLREFLQLLADPSSVKAALDDPPALEERLALSTWSEALYPHIKTTAKARWRKAIAWAILQRRRRGMTGGHTLPRKVSPATKGIPAQSRATSFYFCPEEGEKIIQTCRANGLTFGAVMPVLAQYAMGRVLAKAYVQGKMSQEEWEFRRKQPMVNAGPLNLRPFLDPEWYQAGGATNASLAIGFYFYTLPSTPLGPDGLLRPGAPLPGHLDMFSKARFFHRCKEMKGIVSRNLNHPLFCELNTAWLPPRLYYLRSIALTWREESGRDVQKDETPLSPEEQVAASGFIINHGGATLGNLDAVLPWEYKPQVQGESGTEGTLELHGMETYLHCRPSELYLGASTFRKKFKFHVFWDGNVYGDDVINEWMEELVACTRVYLVQE